MQRAKALYRFDGAVSTDLPMEEGEVVTIINKLPGNLWWEGESATGRIGTFPYNYVEELPPEPEFEEFIGKKGISNLDIIQFVSETSEVMKNKRWFECFTVFIIVFLHISFQEMGNMLLKLFMRISSL